MTSLRLAKIYVPDLSSDEKVEMVLRRHGMIMLFDVFLFVVLLIVPLVVRWFLAREFADLLTGSVSKPLLFCLGSVYYFYIWIYFFATFIDYWLDVWIVTDRRIISLEQKGTFSRRTSEQQLYRIQDVTSSVTGFLPTVLRYGDVVAQAAGTVQNAQLKQIGSPDAVARRIMELVEEAKRHHPELVDHPLAKI